jgi:hypothetical protein
VAVAAGAYVWALPGVFGLNNSSANSGYPYPYAGTTVQENNTFLCYSRFEQDSGIVVNVHLVAQFLAGGYWKPFAIRGKAPSTQYTMAGDYFLACNPPASMKQTGFGVDLSGFDEYPLPTYAFAPTVFAIVG